MNLARRPCLLRVSRNPTPRCHTGAWACLPYPAAAVVLAVFVAAVPAAAQLGPVPAVPLASINRPNGPAAQGADGTITAQTVRPPQASNATSLGQAVWDHPSIRLFGADCGGVVDDSLALAKATAGLAGTGAEIFVPGDCRLNIGPAARSAGTPITFDGVGLTGPGGRDSGYPYGQRGGTVILTDTGGPAFIAKRNAILERLIFFWPAVTEAATTAGGNVPPAFPALVAGPGSAGGTPGELSSLRFVDNDVINATTVIDASNDASGAFFIERNRAFFTNAFLKVSNNPVESFIHDNHFTPFADQSNALAGPTFNLWNYAAAHAAVVLAVGNGTAAAAQTIPGSNPPSPQSSGGFQMHDNYVFGLGYGIRLLGGTLDLMDMADNSFDGVAHPLSIETGGAFHGRWDGGMVYAYQSTNGAFSITSGFPVFYQAADAAPGTDINIDHVRVNFASGGLLDFEAASSSLATIDNVYTSSLNGFAGATADAVKWAAGARLQIRNSTIATAGNSYSCVNLASNAQALVVTNNMFLNCGYVVAATLGTASQSVIANNVALGTRTAIYGGTYPMYLPDVNNSWDKTPYGWSVGTRAPGGDNSYLISYQGVPKLSISPAGALKTVGSETPGATP